MIVLTIGGITHDLSVEDARNLALAIAADVDKPGLVQRFQGVKTAFSLGGLDASAGKADVENLSRAGISLTYC
uniref:hypothetical protein n=1 Tax=Pantoea sp. IMH TaxID=1267600 RepID=UPI0004683683|nr:hypothetical protein [Pantoea sp. IMH]